jgi:isoquinoline 1-oxidoreductase subunit beta
MAALLGYQAEAIPFGLEDRMFIVEGFVDECREHRRVRVDRASGDAIVEKLTLVVDAGTIVHPDGAKAQVEGASLWGLSMALHEGSEFVNGLPKDTNLDTYTPLRMGDVPEIEVELIPSSEAPVGLGEPATTPVAPAIANAIFAATGARVRHLPIRAQR